MLTRKRIRYLAIIGLIAYAILRFFLVRSFFEEYGVDPLIFLAIDCVTAVFYVLGIEHLIVSLKDNVQSWPKILLWSGVTAVSFAAPYAYIYLSSSQLPASVGVGIGIIILLLLLNALRSLLRRVKEK